MSSNAVKLGALGLLTVQNSALSLVMARSRVPDADGHIYLGPTAVFLVELLKVLISLSALFYTRLHAAAAAATPAGGDWLPLAPSAADADADEVQGEGKRTGLWEVNTWRTAAAEVAATVFERSGLRLAIPALLYVCQNNLQLVAASHMDGALLQTFSQGKLISTALFATLMLHKKLSRWQWTSVAALGLGVILVQQGSPHGPASAPPPPGSPPPSFALSGAATGLIAITTACVISGFAGVYTEMILKGQAEFWAVNAQLSAFSLVPALIPLLTNAMDAQGHWAPMRYFGAWAWASVLLNVSGGLLVSLVVKVADNVAKGFAVALAIVLTFLFSAVFLSYSITLACAAGVAVVVLSMVVYSTNPPPKPAQSETVFDARETDAHDTEYESADQSMDERSDSPPHTAIRLPTHVISEEEDKLG